MKKISIHSARCWINNKFDDATIHIENEKIVGIAKGVSHKKNYDFKEYNKLIIMPGIIDAHIHINEPGRTHWEGFDTATKAAALGGVTTLIEMPLNAIPVTINANAFKLKKEAAKKKLHVNCGFYGGIVPKNANDIENLIKEGVFGIKGFLIDSGIEEFKNITKNHLEKIAPILRKYDIPLLLHCELKTGRPTPKIKNPKSYQEYLNSRPSEWELNAIQLAINLQKKFNIKVHIVHLSTAKALEMIEAHQKINPKLTVETCAHYLYFNSSNIPDSSPIYKCAPPIRNKENNDLLWQAILNDKFNFITSDHSPAPPNLKKLEEGDFFKAWGGIAGLQFTLPSFWTMGITKGLTLKKLIPLLTSKPAKFLGISDYKGSLKVGFDADITVWDETQSFIVEKQTVAHKHKETPYLNENLKGIVVHTFVNGNQVVENGKLSKLNTGKLLLRKIKTLC